MRDVSVVSVEGGRICQSMFRCDGYLNIEVEKFHNELKIEVSLEQAISRRKIEGGNSKDT